MLWDNLVFPFVLVYEKYQIVPRVILNHNIHTKAPKINKESFLIKMHTGQVNDSKNAHVLNKYRYLG